MRQTNIRIIEDQTEEIKDTNVQLSATDKEALLAKYYPEYYQKNYIEPKKHQPLPHQKRDGMDKNTQKSNQEYYNVKFVDMDGGEDKINLKIEIKSDMKF